MLKEILCTCYYCFHDWVLILILMEHAQRVTTNKTAMHVSNGLNPYFNGTCSKRTISTKYINTFKLSLNPYFNGTCSKSASNMLWVCSYELRLNPYFNGTCSKS